jgi:hypothetical protein
MQVFLQVSLSLPGFYPFGQPVLQALKAQHPAVVTLDIDSASDEMLVSQACRLVQEAAQVAVYFQVVEPNAELGGAFRVVTEIIQENKAALILLEGTHTRIASIVNARPNLVLVPVSDSSLIPNRVAVFFNQN